MSHFDSGRRYWARVAKLAVAECDCPECGADVGQPCTEPNRTWGEVEREPHDERLNQGATLEWLAR